EEEEQAETGVVAPPAPPPPSAPRPYRPADAAPALPAAPMPYLAPARPPMRTYVPQPKVTEPVHIEDVGRSPEAAPTYTDLNYEARLRASFAAAQGLKGQLDGSWRLSAAGGAELYEIQMADNGAGIIEGVWRDLRRPGAIDGTGFVTDIRRTAGELSFRLGPQGMSDPPRAVLSASRDGGWSGELIEN